MTQDANEFKHPVTGIDYVAEPATAFCEGCAFRGTIGDCIESPPCMDFVRRDGQDVIWVPAVK